MTIIKCRTAPIPLKIGDTPLNRFYVIHNGTAYADAIYQGVSRKTGLPVPMVRSTDEMIYEEIKEQLYHGYRVELPYLSCQIALPGTTDSTTPESLAAAHPVPVVRASAKNGLKTCCQGDDFAVQNITEGVAVAVYSIIDSVSKSPNTLTNGSNIQVEVVGNNLYIPDPNDSSTGAFVTSEDGTILAKARVTESSTTTLSCVFDELALPEGPCRFCVASRNGLDATMYGVSVGRKKITVVNAAEEEEA